MKTKKMTKAIVPTIPDNVLNEMRAELAAGRAKGIEMLKHYHRFEVPPGH